MIWRFFLGRLARAVVIGLLVMGVLWVLDVYGLGLKLVGAVVVLIGAIAWFTPRLGVRLLDAALHAGRAWHWRGRHGTHHAFGAIPLDIREDENTVWIEAEGLRRVLANWEPDGVFLARVATTAWWRDGRRLWLRVDAVIEHLVEAPERMDPQRVRLRLYLERQVMFPFHERRRRADPARPPRR
ncbi:MAG: hypothetical protein ACKOD9_11265 [Rubrivivax sp.]